MINSYDNNRSKIALYLWWGLNIAIVVFVFLAFLFSTLSYTAHLNLANTVNDSFITQQGGLIERQYTVAPNFQVKRGSVTSFCDRANAELCEGLGPRWHNEFVAPGVLSPAELGVFAGMNPNTSIYFFVLMADRTTLRATYIDTSAPNVPSAKGTTTYPLTQNIWNIQAHNTSTPNVAVIMYTSNNETFLQTVTTTNNGYVGFNTPRQLYNIHDPNQNGTAISNLVVAGDWIIVTHGYNSGSAQYQIFVIDGSASRLAPLPNKIGSFGIQIVDVLQSHYLGNGYILQSNANTAYMGKITFNNNAPQIDASGSANYFVHFNSLQIHGVGVPQASGGGQLLFVGTLVSFVDQPITVSMFVDWTPAAPYLTVHFPTNLFGTQEHQPFFGQVSVCHLSPNEWEPYGGIFIAFVDSQDGYAKIVRGRPVYTDYNLHLLPSPLLYISSVPYGSRAVPDRSMLVPTLHCNIATGPGHVLIAMQDFLPVFNTFTWHGGYRYAGLAQTDGTAGQSIDVIRAGISDGYEALTPGFTYYAWNNGTIAPFTSLNELFTSSGYPYPVGTAISVGHLHIEEEAFEYFR